MYIQELFSLKFIWDEQKNQLNKIKHKISFETAKLVFDDPFHINVQDRYENGEERWQTIGVIENVVFLLVAHTIKYDNNTEIIRIISARKATPQERKKYEYYRSR
jgi:uncharacterized DUF497 family protein